jgi:ATP-binding cassette subfamily C protein
MKVMNYQQVPARIIELIALAGIVILVIYAYWFSTNLGQIRAVAALFVISIFRLIPAANRLFQAFMHIKLNSYTIDSLARPGNGNGHDTPHAVFEKELELRGLGFSYGNTQVLSRLDFILPKGRVIGISGASGAGKTTLLRLLMGFQKPGQGQILLDGRNVEELGSISNLFAYVGQDPFVFDGNIMENVALGEKPEDIDQERVIECLEQASLNLQVPERDWPLFNVGEGGNKLSEGQKQRLCLARALYLQRPILLLDEPTSALDAETENSIIESLDALKKSEKTILIIAHRERIFEICDSVYTLYNNQLNKIR